MPSESILLALAQIAVTLAGFAALLITYRRADDTLSPSEAAGQKLIIELSLIALFLSSAPILLFEVFDDPTHIWRVSSALFCSSSSAGTRWPRAASASTS